MRSTEIWPCCCCIVLPCCSPTMNPHWIARITMLRRVVFLRLLESVYFYLASKLASGLCHHITQSVSCGTQVIPRLFPGDVHHDLDARDARGRPAKFLPMIPTSEEPPQSGSWTGNQPAMVKWPSGSDEVVGGAPTTDGPWMANWQVDNWVVG